MVCVGGVLAACAALQAMAAVPEGHVHAVVARILDNVRKMRAADPEAVPMAFWDFDGTIIRGDSGMGYSEGGVVRYRGLIEEVIDAGFLPMYRGEGGYRKWKQDYTRMSEIGPWLAQGYDAQMFAGVSAAEVDAFCAEKIIRNGLHGWYFASSLAIWQALAEAGVENYVVSANIEALVRNAAATLGVPPGRIRGARTELDGGRWTTRLLQPVPYGEGKTDIVRNLVNGRPHGVAIAAFGNSYSTDGPFLRYVATQPSLPGGAVGTAMMINGGDPVPGFGEHFIRVEQTEIAGDATLAVPMDAYHSPANRRFSGIPSIAVAQRTGRLWMTYYAGSTDGEDSNNYSVLVTSTDGGVTWREVLVADPDGAGAKRSFDPEVWIGPDGKLRWTWAERVTPIRDGERNRFLDGGKELRQDDRIRMVELDPEREPSGAFASREIGRGVMMCKPVVTKDGRWLFPNARWGAAPSACVLESRDAARTFREIGGVTLPEGVREYDEHNLVELADGRLRAYMRTKSDDGHAIWQAESADRGRTWGAPTPCAFRQVISRIFVRRLTDGRLLLVKNGGLDETLDGREKMMAFVSDDDGRTWKGGLMLWERPTCAYPDGDQAADGTIFIVFDGNRYGADREMYLARLTVDDILSGREAPDVRRLTVADRFGILSK